MAKCITFSRETSYNGPWCVGRIWELSGSGPQRTTHQRPRLCQRGAFGEGGEHFANLGKVGKIRQRTLGQPWHSKEKRRCSACSGKHRRLVAVNGDSRPLPRETYLRAFAGGLRKFSNYEISHNSFLASKFTALLPSRCHNKRRYSLNI